MSSNFLFCLTPQNKLNFTYYHKGKMLTTKKLELWNAWYVCQKLLIYIYVQIIFLFLKIYCQINYFSVGLSDNSI